MILFYQFIKKKAIDKKIDLKTASTMMNVNYQSLISRLRVQKPTISELMQLSDIYDFSLEDMKREIDYIQMKVPDEDRSQKK